MRISGNISNCSNLGTVTGNSSYLGGIVGYNLGTIENCENSGKLVNTGVSTEDTYYVGGISGFNQGSISECNNKADIELETHTAVGGIVGENSGGMISNCSNEGSIKSVVTAGGIAGANLEGTIFNCSNEGNIKSNQNDESSITYDALIGGIVGKNEYGKIIECTNKGEIYGEDGSIGGIIGNMHNGSISNCTNYGLIKAEDGKAGACLGGICGSLLDEVEIALCSNLGNIENNHTNGTIGGIIGKVSNSNNMIYGCQNEGIIKSTSEILAQNDIGGIIGLLSNKDEEANVIRCNNKGEIQGYGGNVGGIIGFYNVDEGNILISGCSNSASIKLENVGDEFDSSRIGGIAGHAYLKDGKSTISNSYNKGSITSNNQISYYIGGIIGDSLINISDTNEVKNENNKIINCYNVGKLLLNGESDKKCSGGIIGAVKEKNGLMDIIKVENCYYLDGCVEKETVQDNTNIQTIKKSEKEMKETDFVNLLNNNVEVWSYDDNSTNDGYPILNYELKEISIEKEPEKIKYKEENNFDSTGMVVKATYTDGITREILNYTVVDGENLSLEKTNVTISYTEDGITKTATQNITVEENPLKEISITQEPIKTSYIEGQNFEREGMVVTATYEDGTKKEITNYDVIDGENLALEKADVTISFTKREITKTVTQNITVAKKELTEISITKEPTKTNYKEGEKFEKEGMVVTATYNNGKTEEIDNYEYSPNGELLETDSKIIISYTEGDITKTVEQKINVVKAEEDDGQKDDEQENNGQENDGQENDEQENNEQENNGQENNGQKDDEQENNGQENDGQENDEQENNEQENNGQENNGQGNDGQGNDGQGNDGQGNDKQENDGKNNDEQNKGEQNKNNKDTTIYPQGILPQTGTSNSLLAVIVVSILGVVIISYIKSKSINK